jgi:hypothetical protein
MAKTNTELMMKAKMKRRAFERLRNKKTSVVRPTPLYIKVFRKNRIMSFLNAFIGNLCLDSRLEHAGMTGGGGFYLIFHTSCLIG